MRIQGVTTLGLRVRTEGFSAKSVASTAARRSRSARSSRNGRGKSVVSINIWWLLFLCAACFVLGNGIDKVRKP